MSLWWTVLVACAAAYALKVLGYVVPAHLLDGPVVSRMVRLLPIALLAALVVVQAFVTGDGSLVLDARAAGLLVAVTALALRAPFVVVVVLAAATAAGLRAAGIG
ncbi:AzlD domain-containing protein [Luteipulveratus halotolerans]|uniref:Branched-chain amino acid transporter AzlD n=1 Tax=Luteipulveratus halotolerans TaxID=1631356 RepID=A0A0L6CGN6_9MICO|nr:AzlD domain-containing protein [Luteipulveratus halotolerans]KNX36765.1 branched-chain amino acid transporter AzlD [Luteipulveratus halotolerans]